VALRFLHASDIHLLDLRGVRPWRYLNKRFTGAINLALKRGRSHDHRVFDAMLAAGAGLGVDRLVLTGDLTNLALEPEFALVQRTLAGIGLPTTVIPGNHDAYTRGSERARRFEAYLGEFMAGERLPGAGGDGYPFVQRYGDVALIGLSTAIATPILNATGRLGDAQLQQLDRWLAELGAAGLTRIVLIHHPVLEGVAKPHHALRDRSEFAAVIARRGAELVLHGHEHKLIEGELPGPDAERGVPVHGISSGTAVSEKPKYRARFAVYDAGAGRLTRTLYQWDGAAFERVGESELRARP